MTVTVTDTTRSSHSQVSPRAMLAYLGPRLVVPCFGALLLTFSRSLYRALWPAEFITNSAALYSALHVHNSYERSNESLLGQGF